MMLRVNIHPVRSFSPFLYQDLTIPTFQSTYKAFPPFSPPPPPPRFPIHSDTSDVNYQLQIFYLLQTISMQFGGVLSQEFQYMYRIYIWCMRES